MTACPVRIALVQHNPQVGLQNKRKNMDSSLHYIEQAADRKANLVVFPELANTGYSFETRQEAYAHAEPIRGGESVKLWTEAARRHNLFIAAGLAERDGPALYNSAVLIGPEGLVGVYRKTHLWGNEKLVFSPGNTGLPVFETSIGRIGMAICWDAWFPETYRILGVQGADIVCALNNFSMTPYTVFDQHGKSMETYLMMAHAHLNGYYVAAANRTGTERGERFFGASLLAGPQGLPIAAAESDEETVLIADVDLADSRKTAWGPYNDLYGDRRADLYDALLGYRDGTVWPR